MAETRTEQLRRARRERGERGRRNPELIPHGTGGYVDWLCRCPVCKAANKRRQQVMTAERRARGEANPELVPHGTRGGYSNWGCRCPACKDANATAIAARRAATSTTP